jgi:hypothetical protein
MDLTLKRVLAEFMDNVSPLPEAACHAERVLSQ